MHYSWNAIVEDQIELRAYAEWLRGFLKVVQGNTTQRKGEDKHILRGGGKYLGEIDTRRTRNTFLNYFNIFFNFW